ncbi:hypothetical protein [Gemmata sp.]|uniref:hypothetical protein n=1 Tax=Gemmata sp. TaxID=1914242 RepID=UPI003F70BC76
MILDPGTEMDTSAASVWSGCPLPGMVLGMVWPEPANATDVFAASSAGGMVLVPGVRLDEFLRAHQNAIFAVDLERPHGFDVTNSAINRMVTENRLYDVGLLAELTHLAAPGVATSLPKRPVGEHWASYSKDLRDAAVRLIRFAEAAVGRADAHSGHGAERFGLFGIGLDVRGAVAASRGAPGVRLTGPNRDRVLAALAEREEVARSAIRVSPAARTLANTRGGAAFLGTGLLGEDVVANERFAAAILADVRMRGLVPVPYPADLSHACSWDLLAPHSKVAAAAAELRAIHDARRALGDGEVLHPRIGVFPELRALTPDVGYLRRVVGKKIFTPPGNETTFLIVSLRELALRSLAVCLEDTHDDSTLAGRLRDRTNAPLVMELARAVSGLDRNEFIGAAASENGRAWSAIAATVARYVPLGISDQTLEAWLTGYETGFTPSARQVAAARRTLFALIPGLAGYCESNVAGLIAGNLGVPPEEVTRVLGASTAALGTGESESDTLGTLDVLRTSRKGSHEVRDQLVALLGSDRAFITNPMACCPVKSPAALVDALLATTYSSPTGRIYADALPLQVVGRDHVELADGVRKAVYHALVAGGFPVAAFDDGEFVAVVPAGGNTADVERAAVDRVRQALAGWADLVAEAVEARTSLVW